MKRKEKKRKRNVMETLGKGGKEIRERHTSERDTERERERKRKKMQKQKQKNEIKIELLQVHTIAKSEPEDRLPSI